MIPEKKQVFEIYIRNIVFGVEDSLVSTVGLMSGIAVTQASRSQLLLTGIILIFVEAFSMAAGSFLSEHSVEKYENRKKKIPLKYSLIGGGTMFISYLLSGIIPIFPYVIFPLAFALWSSIFFSLFSLFILGILMAKFSKTNYLRNGFETFLVGGLAILVGIGIGSVLNSLH